MTLPSALTILLYDEKFDGEIFICAGQRNLNYSVYWIIESMISNNSLYEIDKIEGGIFFFPPQFFLGNPTKIYCIPVVS